MDAIKQIQRAVNGYKHLTQDNSYASRVENGKVQLVRVKYDKSGNSTVTACGAWMSVPDFVEWIIQLSM
jgi:hypothetical protein